MTCHFWDGAKDRDGYGKTRVQARAEYAHRHAYAEYHGLTMEDIRGVIIRHVCDNPSCVNPLHLLPGTQADNLRDMVVRGRHGRAKLTEDDVRAIRADQRLHRVIAEDYKVARPTVSQIKRGEHWTHVE
jgi:hypothetical protein